MARRAKRAAFVLCALLAVLVMVSALLFPGQRFGLAWTIGTGIGRSALQARIDRIEDIAIRGAPLPDDDRAFLVDFYSTLATGGRASILIAQTGRMLEHYLAKSGTDYELDATIFTGNDKVQLQAFALRERVRRAGCPDGQRLSSPTFYMPDPSQWDSVFGLYHGVLHVTARRATDGVCELRFRAEVPWIWPSYAGLKQKYGTPHAESFPLPNLGCVLGGRKAALFVDNGLGAYLEQVNLAKSFLAFGEWTETAE